MQSLIEREEMSNIQVMGHLGADPETRFTPDGKKIVSFNVATKIRKGGTDETVWYRCTMWEDRSKIYDKMMPYLKKGSAIIVSGELRPAIYTDKEGRPQLSLDVQLETMKFPPFGRGSDSAQPTQGNSYAQSNSQQPYASQGASSYGTASSQQSYANDEPIPF